jgi:hypothetical protein
LAFTQEARVRFPVWEIPIFALFLFLFYALVVASVNLNGNIILFHFKSFFNILFFLMFIFSFHVNYPCYVIILIARWI